MIAVPGIKFILIGFMLTAIFSLWSSARDSLALFIVGIIMGVLTLFLIYFYRNPVRHIPEGDDNILSIADGKVLSIEDIENDFVGGPGKKVSIFLSVFDPHINRIPIAGHVDYIRYIPGKFFQAFRERASHENEQTEIGLSYGSGKMIFKQIVGILARRIVYNLNEGQDVKGGDIFGMIHFGSRAELILPGDVEITVIPGQKVKAGETIIATLRK